MLSVSCLIFHNFILVFNTPNYISGSVTTASTSPVLLLWYVKQKQNFSDDTHVAFPLLTYIYGFPVFHKLVNCQIT